jgi:hypothetical protein
MRVILLLMIRQAIFPTVYTLIFWFGHEVLEFGGFYRDKVGDYGYGHLRESSVTGLGGTGRLEASFGIKSRRHGVRQSSSIVLNACMAYIYWPVIFSLRSISQQSSCRRLSWKFIAAFDHGPSGMHG